MKFNEIITDESGSYTQVCEKCLKENKIKASNNSTIGLCEVEDCANLANYIVEIK